MSKSIGIFHYQVGHTDGVSLEIDKWKSVLEEMGCEVHLCAGDLGAAQGTLIEEMYHHLPPIERLASNAFNELRDFDPAAYRSELERWADRLAGSLRAFIRHRKIELLIPQNVWSIGLNPPLAIALERVRGEFDLPALAQHHDFYWERGDGLALTCPTAIELADRYLPPREARIRHVVINSLAQRQLAERKGIQASVVPNIFDFEAPPWALDDFNRDLRARLGLSDGDLVILQATRIVPRKGIELAIDFVKALGAPDRRAELEQRSLYNGRKFGPDSRIVLFLAGYDRDDAGGAYLSKLQVKAQRTGVDLAHVEGLIEHSRQTRHGQKIYSLWDAYAVADFVSYPSLWEGWGNQFLEAVRARLPILLFEYPVYHSDIAEKGFEVVSLGAELQGRDPAGLAQADPELIQDAAQQAVSLLTDARRRQATVEHNFQIGQKHYSMDALRTYLRPLLAGTIGLT
jgi:glycosyltransferase involved in cell wall biosynthesis